MTYWFWTGERLTIWWIEIANRPAFASRSHARALAVGLPRQDHVWIFADQSVHFHKNELDEMPWKLDSSEYASLLNFVRPLFCNPTNEMEAKRMDNQTQLGS